MAGEHLEHSSHEMTELSVVGRVKRDFSRMITLACFGVLVGSVSWEVVVKG